MGDSTFSSCAYCWVNEESWDKILNFSCDGCGKRVHYGCIRSCQPSVLFDDTFFDFKCEACSEDGKEEFSRKKLSWHNVVMLALHNLQKLGGGRCGFFHWKGHICQFIDKHWITLFGYQRKQTTLWMGTVAGALSSGCPAHFTSGNTVLVESGYWQLASPGPPLPAKVKEVKQPKQRKKRSVEPVHESALEQRRCRRSKESALTAAIELKEKRATMSEGKGRKKLGIGTISTSVMSQAEPQKPKQTLPKAKKKKKKWGASAMGKETFPFPGSSLAENVGKPAVSDSDDMESVASSEPSLDAPSSLSSSLKSSIKEEVMDADFERCCDDGPLECSDVVKIEPEDSDLEIDLDIGSMAFLPDDLPDMRPSSPDVSMLINPEGSSALTGKSPVKPGTSAVLVKEEQVSDSDSEGPSENEISDGPGDSEDDADEGVGEEEESPSEDDNEDMSTKQLKKEVDTDSLQTEGIPRIGRKKGRPRKRRRPEDEPPPSPPPRLKRISVFEEGELLQKLNATAKKQTLQPTLAQLRRKLICNQTNREFGFPVFDLERQMERLAEKDGQPLQVPLSQRMPFAPKLQSRLARDKETRDLDRFMIHGSAKKVESRSYTRFHQRLVGLKDHELKPSVSPYTTRVLLPFIWRNYNLSRKPIKLQLLQEIQAYPHRHDPTWKQPPPPPIDYCYLRPEYIPSVNALCREFFWPGIDVSECLQYPDFSCVVLYRKIVIAFAFMVPDRGYNEAYISFIFTHPEWRGAGIATFMLYHLIQTCMGKDVLLHVSASNPAMLLYQRFGFKAQELILNFYHKYFPLTSHDSRHAVLMRLSR